jgi:ATP-binding cassette subfamily C (CFTR/MRP) protein 1
VQLVGVKQYLYSKMHGEIRIKFTFIICRALISFVETKDDLWKGYLYAVLMFATASVQTLILAQYFNRMLFVGLRIRTALISAIYRKVRKVL